MLFGSRRHFLSFTLLVGSSALLCTVVYMSATTFYNSKSTISNIFYPPPVLSEDEEFERNELTFPYLTRQPDINVKLHANMSLDDMDWYFFQSVSHIHYKCEDWVRMGNQADGGWSVCQVGPYRLMKPCLVYSFGINHDWSFDDGVVGTYGCKVRAFDPSMHGVDDHIRGGNIYFYKIGFAGSDRTDSNSWIMRSLSTLVKKFNDSNQVIDYLKFDIELGEWEVLESFISNPHNAFLLKYRVKQLALEIHTQLPPGPAHSPPADVLYKRWLTLTPLETGLGYRRWWFTINPYSAYQYKGQKKIISLRNGLHQ